MNYKSFYSNYVLSILKVIRCFAKITLVEYKTVLINESNEVNF